MSDAAEGPWLITAGAADAGARLDRFLADHVAGLSRSRIKALIVGGHVAADQSAASDPAQPVQPGVTYALRPPPTVGVTPQPQAIAFPILFEDRDLLVLDKPAGLVVHPAPGNEDGTLVNALLAHCGDALAIGGERRPGIVHRLDKDTSGVMVVAKTDLAMAALAEAFATRALERSYLALCWGVPSPSVGIIEGAIGRDPRDRKRMAVVPRGGKDALTRYRVSRTWRASLALVECQLATGRTHQIRVHMAAKGHPLVGDPAYLRRVPSVAKSLPPGVRGALLDFPRQALHAAVLGFVHPRSGAALRFETALPSDFQALLSTLDGSEEPGWLHSA